MKVKHTRTYPKRELPHLESSLPQNVQHKEYGAYHRDEHNRVACLQEKMKERKKEGNTIIVDPNRRTLVYE